ncbi:putative Hydroxyacylglutathione hydrolase [Desulfamplus magnetovallimortis]|uniref:Putative Hydroxyacylglutathione hydrolase n=1 Tax=Desulfamplus magnetovallimortis TaxID=1246637 RepID=A0A1W1H9K9_9BACT|nr:MBL fold metallo-hydrolase [Desulfamplus magnetovallimortis]SLM29129.1 putative Hydroxyacylglutathione hydrolase [Desulfamplus magnetovallimortis]
MDIVGLLSQDSMANYSYLIVGAENRAFCVDPWDGSSIFKVISNRGLTLEGIINTHLHFDHTRGNDSLAKLTGAEIFSKESLLEKGSIDLGDGASMEFMDANGHTMDHLVILLKEGSEIVGFISGDVLFNCGVGNCKSGGNVDILYETVTKINSILPDEAILYPGHDYMATNLGFSMANGVVKAGELIDSIEDTTCFNTTMGLERELNLFLQADSLETFRTLRDKRDQWA